MSINQPSLTGITVTDNKVYEQWRQVSGSTSVVASTRVGSSSTGTPVETADAATAATENVAQ